MSKVTVVQETNMGVYIWKDKDGRTVVNEENDVMNIASEQFDEGKIELLRQAAVKFGIEGGHAEFRPGARQINDEELQQQIERRDAGLIPDPYDVGESKDIMDKIKRGTYRP